VNITVFLGAPGSGKGTQAKQLADKFGFTHLSTGDMLRAAIKQQLPVGLKAKSYMDQGNLVPDSVMIELIEEALAPLTDTARIILDGFPRTVPQAGALDKKQKTQVNRAISFQVSEKILISRLTGRRTCPNCGESYHLIFIPPSKADTCNKCETKLIQRTDDSEQVVQRRLDVFKTQNQGLLDYFSSHNKLTTLDANKTVSDIQSEILRVLER
jgi:adenylate kinase